MAGVVRDAHSRGTRGGRCDDWPLGEAGAPSAISLQQRGGVVPAFPNEGTQDAGTWKALSNAVRVRSATGIAGDKTGDDRWYDVFVPRADDLYDEHLRILAEEGLI